MTKHAGETLLVTITAEDFDTDVLDNDDIDGVVVSILDDEGGVVVSSTAMTWNVENLWWQYVWDTPTTAGYYYAKCVLTDLEDNVSIEYQRIRLFAPPYE